ncbi:MAG TPA: PQQ-dependent sugar dehydrogenase [Dysgonamonadaceae bacterium]|nr:PQQ-dependent sugar dehydrogenase [Dysgonamonadaceae bacterium]
MKNLKLYSFLIAIIFVISCTAQNNNNEDVKGDKTSNGTDYIYPPVETKAPNADYKPAFEGQTRISGVKTTTPYEVNIIAEGLSSPWSVASLPDGRLAVTEKAGKLRIVTKEGVLSDAITGFPNVDNRGQGGLLDVVPAPDFNTSRMLYFTFAERKPEGSLTAVGKGKLSADESKIENFEVIFRAIPYFDNSMHFGSRIVFDNDGNIFVSTGERSDLKTRPKAQLLDNGYGKVVYITSEGKPVEGNPFVNIPDALPEIYSYGHRNPQGLDIHPETGELWLSEMGPRGGDELNLIKSGENYGWATIGYGIEYNGDKVGGGITQKDGMEQPVYYWDPVLSPSGMTFYSSDVMPEWKNNLFIGGLSSKHIARIVIQNNKVIGEERLLEKENQRFRDLEMGNDGALYAVTDEGRLYRIAKKL